MELFSFLCHPSKTRGIWLSENPFDFPFPRLMAQMILVVLTSRLLYFFLKPLGQTKVTCNLLGGIILGPSVIGDGKLFRHQLQISKEQIPLFQVLPMIGVAYSVFLMAVKFDPNMIKRTAKKSWKIGASFLFPSLILVYPLSRVHGNFDASNIVALLSSTFASCLSFFPVIAEALYELNLMTSESGQVAMSSAVLNDIVLWLLIIFNIIVSTKGIEAILSTLGLLLFTFYILRPSMLLIIKKTPKGEPVKEIYIVAILLGVLVMAFMTDVLGQRSSLAPFSLGLIIPDGPPLGEALTAKTELLVSEFLMPMFFFAVGREVNVFLIHDWTRFAKLQILILALFVTKIMGVTAAGLCSKFTFKNSLILSMIMSMKGIVDLMIYCRWYSIKYIDEQFFTQLILSALVTSMIVTPVVRFSYTPRERLRISSKDSKARNIQSFPNDHGTLQILCCVHNEESACSIITLLEASNPTEASPICMYIVHAVDLIGSSATHLTPYKKKKKLRRLDSPAHQMMRAFENYSENSRGPVIIHPYTMVAPYKSMHETIFRLARDKLVPLIIIPFPDNHHQSIVGNAPSSPIRQMILNLQAFSQCTIGILVDKGLHSHASVSKFSYVVAVFFIGGLDDREAVAYASRMADNPDVAVTVFRILVRNNNVESGEEEQREFKLDESLLDEFKVRNTGNDRMNWHDIEVDDGVDAVKAIRNLQGEFDLVMVGRRHLDITTRLQGMADEKNFVCQSQISSTKPSTDEIFVGQISSAQAGRQKKGRRNFRYRGLFYKIRRRNEIFSAKFFQLRPTKFVCQKVLGRRNLHLRPTKI